MMISLKTKVPINLLFFKRLVKSLFSGNNSEWTPEYAL